MNRNSEVKKGMRRKVRRGKVEGNSQRQREKKVSRVDGRRNGKVNEREKRKRGRNEDRKIETHK